MLRHACACVLALLVFCFAAAPEAGQRTPRKPPPPPPPIAPLDLGRVLDLYASGQFDQAVSQVARAGDEIGRNLRLHWPEAGRRWIDADPARGPQRMLAAAALALETERVRAERGEWRVPSNSPTLCAAPCVLDWAQGLLVARGAADAAERAWYLAAAALAGGDRDWRYLRRPIDPARAGRAIPGLMDRAVERFPGDAALRLEQALAAAGRFNVLGATGRLAEDFLPPQVLFGGRGDFLLALPSRDSLTATAGMLAALTGDPLVGPEASVRLGYLQWAGGREDAAREELTKAADGATDPDVRYLAQFLLGWTAMTRGHHAAAIPALEAALATRPGSQSAAVALAALELQRGDADKSHEIARTSLEQQRPDPDPWRLFLYGHHPHWPARLAELRRQVKP